MKFPRLSIDQKLCVPARWTRHCVHERVPARSVRGMVNWRLRTDLDGPPEAPGLARIGPPGRGAPYWPVFAVLVVPKLPVSVPRSRPPAGKRLLFLDAHRQRLARCAAGAIRASPVRWLVFFFAIAHGDGAYKASRRSQCPGLDHWPVLRDSWECNYMKQRRLLDRSAEGILFVLLSSRGTNKTVKTISRTCQEVSEAIPPAFSSTKLHGLFATS
jgi:hypothetical protein